MGGMGDGLRGYRVGRGGWARGVRSGVSCDCRRALGHAEGAGCAQVRPVAE